MKRIARDEIINAPEHRSRRSPSTPTHLGLAFASFVRSRAGWRRRDDESGRDAVGRARTARGVSTLVGLEARAERNETNTDR